MSGKSCRRFAAEKKAQHRASSFGGESRGFPMLPAFPILASGARLRSARGVTILSRFQQLRDGYGLTVVKCVFH